MSLGNLTLAAVSKTIAGGQNRLINPEKQPKQLMMATLESRGGNFIDVNVIQGGEGDEDDDGDDDNDDDDEDDDNEEDNDEDDNDEDDNDVRFHVYKKRCGGVHGKEDGMRKPSNGRKYVQLSWNPTRNFK